eukprot:TRINITY_DN7658_c0_g1_i1.p2 TRINITY_DN7658_c0_g1~~TRINITY_DN7658_c0_g1_i1.p2  ORF type:complete len:228 (-),score=25.90 TRINITY_DN7658_c0_g1_i1:917-1600(-)
MNYFSNYPGGACSGNRVFRSHWTFGDQSGSGDYLPNLSCSWTVLPVCEPLLVFVMNSFSLADDSWLAVFHGSDGTGTLIGNYTGESLSTPNMLVAELSGPAVFVQFQSGAEVAPGFSLSYYAGFCAPAAVVTAPSGTFSDGSGGSNFQLNINCQWSFSPNTPVESTVFFLDSYGNTNGGSQLTVYDGQSTVAPVIMSVSSGGSEISWSPSISTSGHAVITWSTASQY